MKKHTIIQTLIVAAILLVSIAANAQTADAQQKPPKPCSGTTAAGNACKSIMVGKEGFCQHHNPDALRCAGLTAKKEPCKMIVKVKGDYCRYHTK